MMPLLLKALLSAGIIVVVVEIAKRSPALGALVASLPLVSVLAMVWLWHDTRDTARLAEHAQATFWYVLPSLPMFLLIPAMLRSGVAFWPALGIGLLVTALLFAVMSAILGRFGITL